MRERALPGGDAASRKSPVRHSDPDMETYDLRTESIFRPMIEKHAIEFARATTDEGREMARARFYEGYFGYLEANVFPKVSRGGLIRVRGEYRKMGVEALERVDRQTGSEHDRFLVELCVETVRAVDTFLMQSEQHRMRI